jgi:tetratricopeptide (TPR) repeat protein
MKNLLLVLTLLFFSFSVYSQSDKTIDSLKLLIESAPNDSTGVRKILKLSNKLRHKNVEEAKKYVKRALELSETLKFQLGIADANNLLGMLLTQEGKYAESLECNRIAIPIQLKMKDDFGLSRSYNGMGSVFYMTYNLDSCINYFLLATTLSEKMKNLTAMKSLYSNLAVVLEAKQNFPRSLEFHKKAVELEKAENDVVGLAESYINMSVLYTKTNEDSTALWYLDRAFETLNELHDTLRLINVYSNYSVIYDKRKQYDKALDATKTALNYAIAINNEENLAYSYLNVGDTYMKMKNLEEAEKYYFLSIPLCEKMDLKKCLMDAYNGLSEVYSDKENYKSALFYKNKYVAIKDSTDKQLYSENMLEMETKFDVERKEREIALLSKDKLVVNAELEKRKGWISFFAALVIAFVVLSLFIIRTNINRKKANLLLVKLNSSLTASKDEIALQKEIVEEKQKEILDSIHYAKRIQKALLPSEKYIEKNIEKYKGK